MHASLSFADAFPKEGFDYLSGISREPGCLDLFFLREPTAPLCQARRKEGERSAVRHVHDPR